MQTYLNDPQLKAAFLGELARHEAADALIKGSYGQMMNGIFTGGAIGCSLHSLNVLHGKVGKASAAHTGVHSRYEAELGLPTWFAYMEDQIFERLPDDFAKTWPRRLAEAIPVGAVVDDVVLAKILRWVLTDAEFGARGATDDEEIRGYIDDVANFFNLKIAGGTAEQREAVAAWDARAGWADWDAWDVYVAWAARVARAAWDVWVARATWDVWDAWARTQTARAARKQADEYFPALAAYVIELMRTLPATEENMP